MGDVIAAFSMSVDGYIAGKDEDFSLLFQWYATGDTDFTYPNGMTATPSAESAAVIQETLQTTGALICGRRLFDLTNGWGGNHPVNVPVFVVMHHPDTVPESFKQAGSAFTFVTEGIERAVELAQQAAGDKTIGVASANIAQQCNQAGLLDGFHVDLVPFVLGGGVPPFENLGTTPITMKITKVVAAPHVTHLTYKIVK